MNDVSALLEDEFEECGIDCDCLDRRREAEAVAAIEAATAGYATGKKKNRPGQRARRKKQGKEEKKQKKYPDEPDGFRWVFVVVK